MADGRHCLYCDGELGDVLFSGVRDRLGVSDKEWTFRRCKSCGSVVLDPMPTLDELIAAYPPDYHVDEIPQNLLAPSPPICLGDKVLLRTDLALFCESGATGNWLTEWEDVRCRRRGRASQRTFSASGI